MDKKKNPKIVYILFFIAALYFSLIILVPGENIDFLASAGAGIILLIASYFLFDKLQYESDKRKENEEYIRNEEHKSRTEYLAELEKIQKATYMVLKKGNLFIEEQLKEHAEEMDKQSSSLANIKKDTEKVYAEIKRLSNYLSFIEKNIIKLNETEKSGYQALVKYNKENAKQLALNSNKNINKVIAEINSIKNSINQNPSKMSTVDFTAMEAYKDESKNTKNEIYKWEQDVESDSILKDVEQEININPSAFQDRESHDIDISDFVTEEILEVNEEVKPEPEVVPERVQAEEPELIQAAAPNIDLSDPNKKMNADDIAALFASMGSENDEPVPEPEEEPVIIQEAVPNIDLSDPNKKMSADDIAALFASMGSENDEPVPEPEEEPVIIQEAVPNIDLSDPNKKMSADDIAALFASMGSESDEPVPELEPEEEPVKIQTAAPNIDLSDPNKKMSDDDIAALIAAMGN